MLWYVICSLLCYATLSHTQDISKRTTRRIVKVEDHSFQAELERAVEECSYLVDQGNSSIAEHNATTQTIMNKVNERSAKEFYQKSESERKRMRKHYEEVERVALERAWRSWNQDLPPGWRPNMRSRRSAQPRRSGTKTSSYLKHHSNCTSRCIFSRLRMVDSYGFPQEALIHNILEDSITEKSLRIRKMRLVSECFEEASLGVSEADDNCILAKYMYKCMGLEDKSSWI